ncbi:MAG: sodium-independent anion transporter [Terrimicrobiaceae bacterium]
MEDAMQRIGTLPRVLILRLHLVSAMNATALNALESIVERMQHGRGVVILSGVHRQPLEMLRKAGFVEVVGHKNFCATFDNALLRANQVLAESGDS